jgi:hypothetical protein
MITASDTAERIWDNPEMIHTDQAPPKSRNLLTWLGFYRPTGWVKGTKGSLTNIFTLRMPSGIRGTSKE